MLSETLNPTAPPIPGDTTQLVGDPPAEVGPVSQRAIPKGTILDDRYEVLDVLGIGGMGQVLRARDIHLARDVAVKLLKPQTPLTDGIRRRFLTEAQATARVRHENVVTVFAFGEFQGAPYMALEYVDGIDLGTWLRQCQAISEGWVLGVLEQICNGVEAIHKAGAVHRDIKPSNVLLGRKGRVVIGDLGLARFLAADPTSGSLGTILGTPRYMAPEAILGTPRRDLEPLADVYSLGVLAFEMLTGRAPFEGANVTELMSQHLTVAPPRPSTVASLHADFDPPLLATLSKDPLQRPATPKELFAGLLSASELASRRSHLTQPTHK